MFENQERPDPCVICNEHHDQMLMLSCVHDPCINCAAVQYVENQPLNSINYSCGKCGQITELDHSSVLQLQKIYHQAKNAKKFNYRKNIQSSAGSIKETNTEKNSRSKVELNSFENSRQRQKSYQGIKSTPYYPPNPVSQPSYPTTQKRTNNNLVYPCHQHPDEELTYFCFSCTKPICPECAIHGTHKDHEVQTTRKAIKQIKGLLTEDRKKIDTEIISLMNKKENHKQQFKDYGDENKKDHQHLRKKMALLKNIVNEKEREFAQIVDLTYGKNCEIVRLEGANIDKMTYELNQCKKGIDSTMKKEDLVVLQEFQKRNDEVNFIVEKMHREKQMQEDYHLKNPESSIDFNQFEDEFEQLIGVIENMKLSAVALKK